MPRSGDGIYQQGKTWWLEFMHYGKRHCVRLGSHINRTVAREIARVERARILRGEAGIGRKPKDIGFKEAREQFEKWLEVNRKPNTVKSHKEALKQLAKTFEGKKLSQITTGDLERYKASRVLANGRGRVSANAQLAVFSSMVNRCRKWGLFGGENPVRGVQRFRESRGRTRFLAWEEEFRLLRATPEPVRTILLCGVDAGLRIEAEALNLRWSGLDFRLGLLTVEVGYSKNGESGSVPMTERLKEALLKHRFQSGKQAPQEHVFINRRGKPLRDIRNVFAKARNSAGFGKDVTPHVCRHTFASRLVMAGVDIPTVMKLMRHKSIQMTMRYAHLSPKHERDAVARLAPPPNISGAITVPTSCDEVGNTVTA
jgi:integrase